MKKGKFSETERLAILAKVVSGTGIDEVCREYQISAATLYKWRKEQADLQDETKRHLKQLESENARLKKMYADLCRAPKREKIRREYPQLLSPAWINEGWAMCTL